MPSSGCFDQDPKTGENLAEPEPDTHAVLLSRQGRKAGAQALGPSFWTSCSRSEAHSFTSRDASEKTDGQNPLSPLTTIMLEMLKCKVRLSYLRQ